MRRFAIYDLRFAIWLLAILQALSAPAATIKWYELPTTNRVAGTNYVIVGIDTGTNGTKVVSADNFFASFGESHMSGDTITLGTNILYFTNQCYTTPIYGQDTNHSVIVSNAGLAAVNGIYITNNVDGFTQGVYKICFDIGFTSFVISNATQKVYGYDDLGGTDIGDGFLWSTDFLGNPPAPRSWWGPITITNCFTVLTTSAGLALPSVSSNIYVMETGNDTNALRGRIDRPWRNIQTALLASQPGDEIIVGPGNYPKLALLGSGGYVSNRVSITGAGRGITTLGMLGDTEFHLYCASEVTLRDFTIIGDIHGGAPEVNGIATNCLLDGLEILGRQDIVHLTALEGVYRINNCRGSSSWDGLACFESRAGSSNRVVRITGCDFSITNAGSGNALRMLLGNDARIEAFNSSFSIVGYASGSDNAIVYMDVAGLMNNNSGSVLLSNCRIFRSTTNFTALLVTNFLNRVPIFFENCTPAVSSAAYVSGSYSNGWFDRIVSMPNGSARTNRLVDTRSLTNSLCAASEQGFRILIRDDGGTASGTNIQIFPSATQKINQQSSTNIVTDYGSMELEIKGTNWTVIRKF
jgi:hypothetical protein